MRVCLICGCLEPGKDGVGDYSRRLVAELVRLGHQGAIVAINDPFVDKVEQAQQSGEQTSISTLRLPANLGLSIKIREVKEFINTFDPDWLSLQFVPYAFQEKGLPLLLPKMLKEIGDVRKWHMMFHELSVGLDRESSVKHKLIGYIQRRIIKKLRKQLKPTIIHTQTPVYQYQLLDMGIRSQILPLFGNIPITAIRKHQVEERMDTPLKLLFFGSIQPGVYIERFISDLKDYRNQSGRNVILIFIGRLGHDLNTWIPILKKYNIAYTIVGEASADVISRTLSEADWGVSTTPLLQIEKSGCVASMREHGLPILCIGRNWTFSKKYVYTPPIDIRSYNAQEGLDLNTLSAATDQMISLTQIAEQFLTDLYA